MSASTETLVKLRSLTGQGKSRANVTVPNQPRKYKEPHSYNIRVNRINALNNVQFGGNYSFQVPAFSQVVGEMWIEMTLPQVAGGTYKKYPLVEAVDLITYRAGQKFYEFRPRKDLPLLLQRVKDDKMKAELLKLYSDHSGSASANPGTYILPLITPMSIWHTDKISQPIKHNNRGGSFWDASRLADNLVIELQMRNKAGCVSDPSQAFSAASDLGNVTLCWEEVVAGAADLEAIRRACPKDYCIEEYTRLDDQVANPAAPTVYKTASLVSRAGTTGFVFRARAVGDDALNCMSGAEHLTSLIVNCDGRDIYSTDNRSDDQRAYQKLLAGDPAFTSEPKYAHYSFSNNSQSFDAGAVGSLLKNGSCNELDLTIQTTSGCDRIDVIAVHLRSFRFKDGTIRVSNAY